MARWKLMTAHYLNCDDTEWEYTELSYSTGKQIRKRFPVPRFLNPADPADWTNKWGGRDNQDGEVIVCHAGKGISSDITFYGDPTPDMTPQDDEAKEISASFFERWRYKPEVAEVSFSQSLIDHFEEAMAEKAAKPAEVPGLADLTAAIGAMVQQQQQMLQMLTQPPKIKV